MVKLISEEPTQYVPPTRLENVKYFIVYAEDYGSESNTLAVYAQAENMERAHYLCESANKEGINAFIVKRVRIEVRFGEVE